MKAETSVAQVGGKGSTVVGRFTSAKEVKDWSKQFQIASLFNVSDSKGLQPPRGKGDEAAIRAVDFWQSEEGIEACDKSQSSGLIITADGTFRADDVLPGEYTLTGFGEGISLNKGRDCARGQRGGGFGGD